MEPKTTNCKDQASNHSCICLLFIYCFYLQKVLDKIMQHMFLMEVSIFNRRLINILCFKSNLLTENIKFRLTLRNHLLHFENIFSCDTPKTFGVFKFVGYFLNISPSFHEYFILI